MSQKRPESLKREVHFHMFYYTLPTEDQINFHQFNITELPKDKIFAKCQNNGDY